MGQHVIKEGVIGARYKAHCHHLVARAHRHFTLPFRRQSHPLGIVQFL